MAGSTFGFAGGEWKGRENVQCFEGGLHLLPLYALEVVQGVGGSVHGFTGWRSKVRNDVHPFGEFDWNFGSVLSVFFALLSLLLAVQVALLAGGLFGLFSILLANGKGVAIGVHAL